MTYLFMVTSVLYYHREVFAMSMSRKIQFSESFLITDINSRQSLSFTTESLFEAPTEYGDVSLVPINFRHPLTNIDSGDFIKRYEVEFSRDGYFYPRVYIFEINRFIRDNNLKYLHDVNGSFYVIRIRGVYFYLDERQSELLSKILSSFD